MTTMTIRAEQALLGALLAEPGQVPVVARYLTPDDFLSERNGTLYGCMLELSDGPLSGRPWRDDVVQAAGLRSIPDRYLRQLEAACPEPSHGLSYGALVMQARARRAIGQLATAVMRAGAGLSDDATRLARADPDGGPDAAVSASRGAETASALRVHAWAFNPDTLHAPGAPFPAPAPAQWRAGKEETVLAALIRRHPDSGQILGLLTEDAFSTPQRRQIFRAIANLHASWRGIDPLTIDWETARGQEDAGLGRPAGPSARGREPSYVTLLAGTGIVTTVMETALSLASMAESRQQVSAGHARPGSNADQDGARLTQSPPEPSGPGMAPVQLM